MSAPHLVVVGGGLAGLSAAVSALDAGARVTLLEARARLGGATWSTQRDGLWVDNGQHVVLRCCTAYLGFLKRLGVQDGVRLQPRLAIPVAKPGGATHWLRRQALPSPLHLAASFARFGHLRPGERLRAARSVHRLGRLDLDDRALDAQCFGNWLAGQGESDAAIDGFWDLLIRPTLNLPARQASLWLAAKVFQTGLLEAAGNADLGVPRRPLQELHGDAALRALERGGARVRLRARVDAVEADPPAVRVDGERIQGDALILAAPHEEAAALLPEAAGVDTAALRALGRSPIVDLHVVYDRRVTDLELVAGLDTPLQWVFDRTGPSGLERGQYLAVSLSAADDAVGVPVETLRRRLLPELERLFPAARDARVERCFATCERAATFRQAPGSGARRPDARTAAPRLFLAGAWTDTRWPATMEGAVLSGVEAARHALRCEPPARAAA